MTTRKLQVTLLLVGALAMMSFTYCSALGEQTLSADVGRRALLKTDKPVKAKPGSVELANGETPVEEQKKQEASFSSCYDRAGYSTCKAWKRYGYCGSYTYKGWSVPYFWCRSTCYKCNKCVDQFTKTCKTWAYKGYCAPKYTYSGYSVYKVVCPYSCGYCH